MDYAVRELESTGNAGMKGATLWAIPPEGLGFTTDHYEGGLNRSTHHPLDRMMTGGVRGLHNGAGGRAVDQVAAG